MSIRFPLLSILSIAFLAFFAFQGGDVELHSLEVGFSADSQGVTVTVDPAFLIWADKMYPASACGVTFGNVAVVDSSLRNTIYGPWVQRFELNHILQYRALGWLQYPAKFIMPIDPHSYQPQRWYDPSEADEVEWLPPSWFPQLWHFITFSVDFQ